MLISKELEEAINAQIGNEFGASMQYLAIAGYFDEQNLQLFAKIFFDQAQEENEHAMKFVHYLLETQSALRIPAIPAPKPAFASAEEAVGAALSWEKDVTAQINNLMKIAMDQDDYLSQSFLRWYVDEQLEEITKMDQLLSVVRRAGPNNLIMVEAYLAHLNTGV
jgi:bacterioferritin B